MDECINCEYCILTDEPDSDYLTFYCEDMKAEVAYNDSCCGFSHKDYDDRYHYIYKAGD